MQQATTDLHLQISGVLVKDAQVRCRPMGDSDTAMPVLTLYIDTDGPSNTPVCAEQVYPPAMRAQAEQDARSMKKGTRVTVLGPIAHLRTTLAMCKDITVHGRAKPAKSTSKTATKEPAHAAA